MKSRVHWLACVAGGILAIAVLSMAVSTPAWSQTANGQKVSKAVATPLKAAQDALKARRYSEASAKLREVDAISGKSPYEQYLVDEMKGYIAGATKDFPEAARALDASLNSGFVPASEVAKRVVSLFKINYQLKNYDKALDYGNRAIKGGFANDEIYTLMAQTYYLKGDYRSTQKFVENYIDGQLKAGKTPKEEYFKFIMSACTKLNDTPCVTRVLEKLVAYYPKNDYWQGLMASMMNSNDVSDRNKLQLFRLASEVNVLKRGEDYTEMAQLAQEQGAYAEAERILQKGFEKKVFADQRTIDKNNRLLAVIQKSLAADKAALLQKAQAASASPNGDDDVNVGIAYLSYQQYPQAIQALQAGLSKPFTDPKPRSQAEVKLLIGIAQLASGDKDSALKTFHAVKGDPQLERLANLWSLHARQA